MSYFDDASLVMIPSGYKTSKVYSVKPTDGTGDLTFTRTGDTATRVNSAGLIEKVRTNLITYSQDFDNASWTKSDATVTANATTAPDGTTTADKLLENSANAIHFIGSNSETITAGSYTASVFAKAAERNILQLFFNGSANITAYANFNLTTGTVTASASSTATIESFGNGWYRCTITATLSTSVVPLMYCGLQTSPTAARAASYLGNGTSGLLLWGAQLEVSDFGATAYIPTTTAAVSVGPVANVPRLDYLGSTCPRLLLEPQRTNLALYSEQFDNANWVKSSATIAANTAISPDGYQNADTLTPTSASTNSGIDCFLSTSASAHTMSIYAKVTSGTKSFRFFRFNATDGSVISPTFTATTTWQRFTWTTTPSVAGNSWYIVNAAADTIPFHIWGAQIEVGAYATSYIPTLAASATRGADACSKTGISSLIGQTEGTLFADFFYVGNTQAEIIDVSDGTENNRIMFYVSAGSQAQVYITNGGSSDGFIASSFNIVAGTEYKIAIGYKANDLVLYINGTQIGTDTSLAIPATSKLTISNGGAGNYPMASRVNQALVFKTRLSNADLAALTA